MKIEILSLSRFPGESVEVKFEQSGSDLLISPSLGSSLEKIGFDGRLMHIEHGVFLLKGVLTAVRTGQCDRCLKPAKLIFTIEVEEEYRRLNDPDYYPETDECYGYAGHMIELDQAIRDNLLLNMPLKLLCREDCPGFCPVCGRDLSEGSCDCSSKGERAASPFDQLSKLLQDD